MQSKHPDITLALDSWTAKSTLGSAFNFSTLPHFFAFENRRHLYFSPPTVISRAPSWLSWFDAVPMRTLFSFSRFSFSIFSLASCRAISTCREEFPFKFLRQTWLQSCRNYTKRLHSGRWIFKTKECHRTTKQGSVIFKVINARNLLVNLLCFQVKTQEQRSSICFYFRCFKIRNTHRSSIIRGLFCVSFRRWALWSFRMQQINHQAIHRWLKVVKDSLKGLSHLVIFHKIVKIPIS